MLSENIALFIVLPRLFHGCPKKLSVPNVFRVKYMFTVLISNRRSYFTTIRTRVQVRCK